MNYDIGDVVRIMVTFQTISGAYIDPTTVVLKILLPTGVVLQRQYPTEVVKSSSGQYYYDFSVTVSGTHSVRWEGTSPAQGAGESTFEVNVSAFS